MSLKSFVDSTISDFLGAGAKLLLVAEYHNDPKVEAQRKRICQGYELMGIPACESYNKDRDQCRDCKCIIDIKAKTLTNYTLTGDVEITHCPKAKWEDSAILEYSRDKKLSKILESINKK